MSKKSFPIVVAVALLPALLTFTLITLLLHAEVTDFRPLWSDEIDYWHETFSFARVGFGNGYYSVNEVQPPLSFTHYGPHGPAFPMLIGTIGAIFGWSQWSAPVVNAVLITIALAVCFYAFRLTLKQLLPAALLLITFWPMLLYIPTNMQESLHQAAAIILSGIFSVLIRKRTAISSRFFYGSLAFILVLSVVRSTWSFLLIPLFLLRLERFAIGNIMKALVPAVVLIILEFLGLRWLASPNPTFIRVVGEVAGTSRSEAASMFLHHAVENATHLLRFSYGSSMQSLLWLQVVLMIVVMTGYAVGRGARKSDEAPSPQTMTEADVQTLFHLLNLGVLVMFVVFFYDVGAWRDYRLYAPHLLLSLLVLVELESNYWLVYPFIALNMVFAGAFLKAYKGGHQEHFARTEPSPMLHMLLHYKPADEAWCNTLLVDLPNYNRQLLDVPAGMGISMIMYPESVHPPVRSRYLLLNNDTYQKLKENLRVKPISTLGNGVLYLNLESECRVPTVEK
jgi:hypothetical protein